MRTERRSFDVGGMIGAVVFILLGAWVLLESSTMSAMGSIFPRTIATAMIVLSLMLIGLNLAGRYKAGVSLEGTAPTGEESTPRRLFLVGIMLAWVLLMPVIGFLVSSIVAFLAIMVVANYDGWTARRTVVYAVAAFLIVVAFYWLMVDVLLIPVPDGLFI